VKARAAIRVQPGAKAERVAGLTAGEWKIAVTAPPVEGKANQACIEFFARGLRRPRSAVRIVAGAASRRKRIEIEGVAQETLDRFLREAAGICSTPPS
jgi:uncharacterized protein (TIGR00251 family)